MIKRNGFDFSSCPQILLILRTKKGLNEMVLTPDQC